MYLKVRLKQTWWDRTGGSPKEVSLNIYRQAKQEKSHIYVSDAVGQLRRLVVLCRESNKVDSCEAWLNLPVVSKMF